MTKIFNKTFNFEEPTYPTIEEYKSMSWLEYKIAAQRALDDYNSRTMVEKMVIDAKRVFRSIQLLVTVPGFFMALHLPAFAASWLLNQIIAGKWWLIGPEAWVNHAINMIEGIMKGDQDETYGEEDELQ